MLVDNDAVRRSGRGVIEGRRASKTRDEACGVTGAIWPIDAPTDEEDDAGDSGRVARLDCNTLVLSAFSLRSGRDEYRRLAIEPILRGKGGRILSRSHSLCGVSAPSGVAGTERLKVEAVDGVHMSESLSLEPSRAMVRIPGFGSENRIPDGRSGEDDPEMSRDEVLELARWPLGRACQDVGGSDE